MAAMGWMQNLDLAGTPEGTPVGPGNRRDWLLIGIGRAVALWLSLDWLRWLGRHT